MFRDDSTDTIWVMVGDPLLRQEVFFLETQLFTKRSVYLAKCIAENPHEQIYLPETTPRVFRVYIDCIRNGSQEIETWSNTFELSTQGGSREKQNDADAVFHMLIDLYSLAGKMLLDDRTAHLATDEIIRFSDYSGLIPEISMDCAYRKTENGDRLRRLLSDFWIYETATAGSERLMRKPFLHKDAMHDIAMGLLPLVKPIPGFEERVEENYSRDKCYYHDHENTARCDNLLSTSDD